MKTLVVNKDGTLEIKEVEVPKISDNQALVKTIACGMCGTDVKLIHRTFKGFPESIYPVMLGHEGVGEVVKIGKNVKGYHIGDKVLLSFVDADPDLYGNLHSAWGACSEYGVVNDLLAFAPGEAPECAYAQKVLPDNIDKTDAAMIITFREVLSNIKYFGIGSEDSIVIFGCGPVGLTFVKFLSLLGVKEIIAVDVVEEKLKTALGHGATKVLNSKTCILEEEVRKLFPEGGDYVLDAVGSPNIVNQSMGLIRDRGSILCYGIPEKEQMTLDFSKASYNWSLVFQQFPKKIEEGAVHEQIMEWIQTGKLDMKEFISDYFRFEDAVEGYAKLLNREVQKKGIITFQEA